MTGFEQGVDPGRHPFRVVWEDRDLAAWSSRLAPDVVAYSPILTTTFAGKETVEELYAVLLEELINMEITEEFRSGNTSAFFWRAGTEAERIEGVDLIRLDGNGQVAEITVSIRPLIAIARFASLIGPPLARKRGGLRYVAMRLAGLPLELLMRVVDGIAPWLVMSR